MIQRILSTLFVGVLLLQGASPTIRNSETKQLKEYDFVPQAVATSTEDVFTADVYLTYVRLTNTTAGALTVTIADKSGTPIHLFSSMSVAANTTYIITMPPTWMVGGATWIASGAGIVGYMRGLK